MNVTVNLRFPGQYFDNESGLHQNWFRDYQPEYGRYVEADPIGQSGGVNIYRYAFDNPINVADALGLAPFTNNSHVAIPYKDESSRIDEHANMALPGETVDEDGIYSPPGTKSPICVKVPNNCTASADESGQLSVDCDWKEWDPRGRGRPRILGPDDLSEQNRPDWPDPYSGRHWPYPVWPRR